MRTILICILIIVIGSEISYSQNNLINIDEDKVRNVTRIFDIIQNQLGYKFIYNNNLVKNALPIRVASGDYQLEDLLDNILAPLDCDYKFSDDNRIIVKRINDMSEQFMVEGMVTDNKGIPISGANIVEEGTANGVQSDLDGHFRIEVADALSTLIVSYVGFVSQDIAIQNKNIINITLQEEISALDEVFITALEVKRKRKELGYSFQDIEGDKLLNNPSFSIPQSLYGKVAGVNITQVNSGLGASSRVIIRGNNSINVDNEPLYIVDGVYLGNTGLARITDTKSEKFSSGIDNGDGLSSINLNDIENISVLKGGAASALYGERGANGVIIITTKRGKKNSFNLNYNATVTFDYVDAQYKDNQEEYGSGSMGLLPNSNAIDPVLAGMVNAWGPRFDQTSQEIRIFDGSFKPYKKVNDNIQGFFNTGVTYNNNISVSGGGENVTYRFGYGNLQSKGVIPTNEFNRNSFSLRTSVDLGKIMLDGKFSYTIEETKNKPGLADDPNNIGFSLAGLAPNINQAWLQNYEDNQGNYFDWNTSPLNLNPYFVIAENSNLSTKNRIQGNFRVNYDITDWLKGDMSAGIDRFDYTVSNFINAGTSLPGRQTGNLRNNDIYFQEYNIEAKLFANKKTKNFEVSAAFGGNYRKTERVDVGFVASDMIENGVNSLANFSSKIQEPKLDRKILVRSIFSYLRANYKELVFLDLTARNDWNSTLATPITSSLNYKNNYSFFYPSISGSFIFSKAFSISPEVLSFGKIRTSFASTGIAPEQPFTTSLFYTVGPEPLLGNPLGFAGNGIIPNGEVKPEISNTFEIGTDLAFFKSRLGIDFSYYKTTTKNQLTLLSLSQATGYYASWVNIGEVENRGIEALVTAGIFRNSKGFNWDMTVNFSTNKNKVVSLSENADTQVISIARWGGAQIVAQTGKSTSEIYGRAFQRSPDGQVIIGEDGMPKLDNTFRSLGKATPDWIMGLTNRFSYKGFDLETSVDMKFGGQVYSMTNAYAAASGLLNNTLEGREAYNNWVNQKLDEGLTIEQINALTPEAGYIANGVVEVVDANGNISYEKNTKPVNPQQYWSSFFGDDTTVTPEPFVYDASYVKLRELSLTYNFSDKILQKIRLGIDQLRVSLIGRNLWTIHSNIPNIDPESTYTSGNGQGFEYGSLPYSRSYGFNIQMTF